MADASRGPPLVELERPIHTHVARADLLVLRKGRHGVRLQARLGLPGDRQHAAHAQPGAGLLARAPR